MVSKELRKLSRRELIDIIYQMKKNEQQMQEEITSLQKALQEKRIRISKAGSIADAAVSVTNVFSAAQKAADLYLQEISCLKEETEKECAKKIEEANSAVERILSDGKKKYAKLRTLSQSEYTKWQQLRSEVKRLEDKHGQYEDMDHGEKTKG